MIDTEFGLIINLLIGAYGDKFQANELKIETYFQFLKCYNASQVYDAVYYWIRKNKYPPSISDLLEILGD